VEGRALSLPICLLCGGSKESPPWQRREFVVGLAMPVKKRPRKSAAQKPGSAPVIGALIVALP